MRIKSNFKDYYDIGMGLAHDPFPLYLRKQRKTELKYDRLPLPRVDSKGLIFREYDPHFLIASRHIGFCGKTYPLAEIEITGNRKFICYSSEDVDKIVEQHFDGECLEAYMGKIATTYRGRIKSGWKCRPRRQDFDRFFETQYERFPIISDLWKGRDPIFLFDFPSVGNPLLTVNAKLGDQQFFRIFDAYRAYQEISMWLGNLAEERKIIPKLDDETMAEIKGFSKFSFRKDKSKR